LNNNDDTLIYVLLVFIAIQLLWLHFRFAWLLKALEL